ncbi:MAG: hypothetical protein R6V67_08915 [Spirochaetia bacterium]
MKKILVPLVVILLVLPMAAAAQGNDNTDKSFFKVGLGFLGGYSLSDKEIYAGQDFGFTFFLNDSMLLGLRSIHISNGPGNVETSLLNFGYLLGPALEINLLVGSSNNADFAGGADVSMQFFNDDDGAIKSSLKLKTGYLFFDDGIDAGFINAGLVGSIGY